MTYGGTDRDEPNPAGDTAAASPDTVGEGPQLRCWPDADRPLVIAVDGSGGPTAGDLDRLLVFAGADPARFQVARPDQVGFAWPTSRIAVATTGDRAPRLALSVELTALTDGAPGVAWHYYRPAGGPDTWMEPDLVVRVPRPCPRVGRSVLDAVGTDEQDEALSAWQGLVRSAVDRAGTGGYVPWDLVPSRVRRADDGGWLGVDQELWRPGSAAQLLARGCLDLALGPRPWSEGGPLAREEAFSLWARSVGVPAEPDPLAEVVRSHAQVLAVLDTGERGTRAWARRATWREIQLRTALSLPISAPVADLLTGAPRPERDVAAAMLLDERDRAERGERDAQAARFERDVAETAAVHDRITAGDLAIHWEQAEAELHRCRGTLAASQAAEEGLRAEVGALRAELAAVVGSRSWRITAPLRRLRGT